LIIELREPLKRTQRHFSSPAQSGMIVVIVPH
jgi:hypothetical protein